jgi:hypothetical protein
VPSFRVTVIKTLVTHTVTYFVAGVTALLVFDYPTLMSEPPLSLTIRPLDHPLVMAGPLLQPLRGLLFGVVCYTLRESFFGSSKGWLRLWMVLVFVGILGTFGAPPGSLEGVIYTSLPLSRHLILLPEVLVQSLLFSWLLFQWIVRRPKWLDWTMGVAFVVVIALPLLGLLTTGRT